MPFSVGNVETFFPLQCYCSVNRKMLRMLITVQPYVKGHHIPSGTYIIDILQLHYPTPSTMTLVRMNLLDFEFKQRLRPTIQCNWRR